MMDVEPLIRDELELAVPEPSSTRADWQDVRRRAGHGSGGRGVLATALVAAAAAAGIAGSPLGGAISSTLDGFSDWLTGTPGEAVEPSVQRDFERAGRFPGNPQLRRLLSINLDGRHFFLYGFETRQVVCLRVAVRSLVGAGPEAACVSRADLRRSGDLVLPVKANLTVGHIGRLPRLATDPPTIPRYLLTFGIAAAEVTNVSVEADNGSTQAVVRNGAFLHVLQPGRRGIWSRTITATTRESRTNVVPISLHVSGQPPLRTGLKATGPATVERKVLGGTIGWFERKEPRGVPARSVAGSDCCSGFARVIYPDPDDFLGVAIGDRTLAPRLVHRTPHFPTGDVICVGLVSRGGFGSGCRETSWLFANGPLDLSWGFSGGGQQLWIVSGVASDDVARIEVFLGDGKHWRAPLRDNATVFRVQRAKFPVRVVGYDAAGRVIAVRTIGNR
jgi:hypothetical protein